MKGLVESKGNLAKKKKRNQIIVAIILLGLMFISVAGYSFQSRGSDNSNTQIIYKNQAFIQQNGFWLTEFQGNVFSFLTDPREFLEISNSLNNLASYQDQVIYLNSMDYSSTGEIYRNIIPFVLRWQEACVENATDLSCDESLPSKNCDDDIIIILKLSDVESVKQDNKCLIVEGKRENLIALTDSAIAKIIGI